MRSFYKPDNIINTVDREALIRFLNEYYETKDIEIIKLKLKKDLRNKDKIDKLVLNSQYEFKELIKHFAVIFDGSLFNKSLIKKIRSELDIAPQLK